MMFKCLMMCFSITVSKYNWLLLYFLDVLSCWIIESWNKIVLLLLLLTQENKKVSIWGFSEGFFSQFLFFNCGSVSLVALVSFKKYFKLDPRTRFMWLIWVTLLHTGTVKYEFITKKTKTVLFASVAKMLYKSHNY